jgi:hypothetical protein
MDKLRFSIKWSYRSRTCTIQNTPTHGMRVFPMSNIATIEPCIAQLATTPFRWGWDSNHWAPWMLHYLWRPPRTIRVLLHQKLTKRTGSLSGSNTSTNRFRILYISLTPSTNNAMINIGCHISFRSTIKFGCICKKNALQSPIGSFSHSVMGRIPSPRLWVTIILSSTFPPSFFCI